MCPACARTMAALGQLAGQCSMCGRDASREEGTLSQGVSKRDAESSVGAAVSAKKAKGAEPQAAVQDISAQRLQSMFGLFPEDEAPFPEASDVFGDETIPPQWACNEELMSALEDQGEPEEVFGDLAKTESTPDNHV
mgnify:CR=1 FL=1